MWLKAATIVLIAFSIGMVLAFPWIVGVRPPTDAPRAEQLGYLRRGAIFVGVEALALILSIVGAFIIARRARLEFREQSQKNMEALLEATLRDHAKKAKDQDADAD